MRRSSDRLHGADETAELDVWNQLQPEFGECDSPNLLAELVILNTAFRVRLCYWPAHWLVS